VRSLFSPAGREALRQFAWSNVLVAFDFDGTLAPIVPAPDKAAMRGNTRRLLRAVVSRYPCIVISGRGRPDLRRRLHGVSLRGIVGNHGIEHSHATPRLAEEVKRWEPVLGRRLSGFRGVRVENKSSSVAVHYRRSREKKRARAAILRAAAALGSIRVIGGKQVIDLLPEGAPHKGIALERERDRLRSDTAIYVGDDGTDEEVFGLDQPGRLLTIRVGPGRASQAAYYIESQAAVDELLAELVALRPRAQATQAGPR